MPVNGLLKEAKELIKDINSEKYIDEYNEILFLLGGNLGILSGDFQTAYRWITLSKDWAEEHKMESFIHRTIRKEADIMLFNNNCVIIIINKGANYF